MEQRQEDPARQSHPTSRRRRALIVATALPLLVFGGITLVLDRPPNWGSAPKLTAREGRAAIAIRDPVHPVEKLGTWLFVRPRLDTAYAEVRTITQFDRGDGSFGMFSHDGRGEFEAALRELDRDFHRVDVYLLGHTNDYVNWIEGLARLDNLGLVYNSGCHCARQAERWMKIGARAYVAHPKAASHAPFFVQFLRHWAEGVRLDRAVTQANVQTGQFYRALALPPLSSKAGERWALSEATLFGDGELSLGEE